MKKFIALLLSFCMIFSLAACGSDEGEETSASGESEETEETDEYGFEADDPEGEVVRENISVSSSKGNNYSEEEDVYILNLMDGVQYDDILYTDIRGSKMIMTYHKDRRLGVCIYDVEEEVRITKNFGKVIGPQGSGKEMFVLRQFYFIGDNNYGLFTTKSMDIYDLDLQYVSSIDMDCSKPYVNENGLMAFVNEGKLHIAAIGQDEAVYDLKPDCTYRVTNFSNEALVGKCIDAEKKVSIFSFDVAKKEITYSGNITGTLGKDAYIRPSLGSGDVFDILKNENCGFHYNLISPTEEEVVINREDKFVTAIYEGDEFSEERELYMYQYNKGQKDVACKIKLVDNVDVFSIDGAIFLDDCFIFPTTHGANPTFLLWELQNEKSDEAEAATPDHSEQTGLGRFGE